MARSWNLATRRLGALLALPMLVLTTTGCLTNAPEGMVGTPKEPGASSSSSRLPQLLSQLQGSAGGGLELLDGSQNQVLAAQEAGGKGSESGVTNTPTPSVAIPIGTVRGGTTATPRPEGATVTATPRQATSTPTPAASPAATVTPPPTATSTATSTPTPTPTASPVATPPTEGSGGTPPHE